MFEQSMTFHRFRIVFTFAAVLTISVCVLLQNWGSPFKSEQQLLNFNNIQASKSGPTATKRNAQTTTVTAVKINPLSITLRNSSVNTTRTSKVNLIPTTSTIAGVKPFCATSTNAGMVNPFSTTSTAPKLNRNFKNITSSSSRNFIYLIQTESCLSDYFYSSGVFGDGCKNDVIVLSWKQTCCPKPSNRFKHINYIYKEGTTWSLGRNVLYDFAKQLPRTYLYYIFMDGDLKFDFTDSDFEEHYRDLGLRWPLQAFEDFLLKHEPAIGMPMYCSICRRGDEELCCDLMKQLDPLPEYLPVAAYFDAAFNAFHKDALDLMLPYRLDHEKRSWWQSQKFVILAADLMFRGQVLRFFPVTVLNVEHREYPRSDWDNWGYIYDILKAKMPAKYRVKVKWAPNYSNINVQPIVRNETMFTPMWSVSIPSGKITIQPYKYFRT